MPCAPNTPIRWSDVYAISSRIDTLATTMNTPSYERLADEPAMPFKFSDLVDFDGAIRFAVTPGTTTVTQQHLSDGVQLTGAHALDPVLQEMGKNNDLFLVVEEDDCWCKTIFKIDTNPGVPRVKEVSSLGCCQSLFVPQPGDTLNYGQHIIAAGYASQYAAGGNPDEGTLWQVKPACVAETVSCGYRFQSTDSEAPLTDCTREIQAAKFTWPIRAEYMDKMIEKLKYILECANSGGAAEDALRTDNQDEPYIPVACEVSICDLVRDRVERGLMDYGTPGCVSQGCNVDADEPNPYPWDSATCGGGNCDSEGPKVYCRTLEDLAAILDAAESGLRPHNPPSEVCGPCNCGWDVECESQTGTAETCYIYAGTGGEALIGFRDEAYFDDPACTFFIQYAYVDGIITYCNDVALNDPCGTVEVGRGEDCTGELVGLATIPIFGGFPSWSGLKEAADAAYDECTLTSPGSCTAGASTFYALPTAPAFPPGAPAAWASKTRTRVRFRMGGSWNCTGGQTSTRTVRYKRIENINGEVTETTGSAIASWDAGEGTYITAWIDEEAPPWPVSNPGYHTIDYEVTYGDRKCPEGCTLD